MKPASALPWKVAQVGPATFEVQTHRGGAVVVWNGFVSPSLSKAKHAENVAYIVHAANSYRKLVETLRSLATSSVGSQLSDVDKHQVLLLLRELGEVE